MPTNMPEVRQIEIFTQSTANNAIFCCQPMVSLTRLDADRTRLFESRPNNDLVSTVGIRCRRIAACSGPATAHLQVLRPARAIAVP